MSVRAKFAAVALTSLAVMALAAFGDLAGSMALAQPKPPTRTPTSVTASKPADAKLPDGVKYANGEFTGSAKGFRGNVDVTVKVVDGMIDSITGNYVDDQGWFVRAWKLSDDILKKQTADGVNTVTGATFSSKGILGATKEALDKAKKAAATQAASAPATSKPTTPKRSPI